MHTSIDPTTLLVVAVKMQAGLKTSLCSSVVLIKMWLHHSGNTFMPKPEVQIDEMEEIMMEGETFRYALLKVSTLACVPIRYVTGEKTESDGL